MNTRAELLDTVRASLAKAGFAVSERCDIRPISFDVVARRDQVLLIVKILSNVDSFSERVASELRTLAQFLRGTPILIGQRSGAGPLEDGVAYNHRGIPVLTVQTLQELLLENNPPLAFATPGGLHVRLDGARLRQLREERALSLGALAQVAGVSRRAIQMYEEGMRATIESAMRLEEYLQEILVQPIDPFQLFTSQAAEDAADHGGRPVRSNLAEEVFRMLRGVGYQVVPTQQSPFEAVSHQDPNTILTGVETTSDPKAARRAQLMTSIASVTEKDGMIIVRRETRVTNLKGTPLLNQQELERLRDPKELADLLRERKRPPADAQ